MHANDDFLDNKGFAQEKMRLQDEKNAGRFDQHEYGQHMQALNQRLLTYDDIISEAEKALGDILKSRVYCGY